MRPCRVRTFGMVNPEDETPETEPDQPLSDEPATLDGPVAEQNEAYDISTLPPTAPVELDPPGDPADEPVRIPSWTFPVERGSLTITAEPNAVTVMLSADSMDARNELHVSMGQPLFEALMESLNHAGEVSFP